MKEIPLDTDHVLTNYLVFIEDMYEFFETRIISCLPSECPFIDEDGRKVIDTDSLYEHLVAKNRLKDPEDLKFLKLMVGSQTFSYKIEKVWGKEEDEENSSESSWESSNS